MKRMRTKLIVGTGVALAAVGGGAAYAAAQGTPAQESRAIVEDVAQQLGIDSQKLTDALEQALENRVDEAVADGRLTEEQGAAMKERIRSGEAPLLGLRGGKHGMHHAGGMALAAAASYLGLTEAELRAELADGQSLAEVARAEGKSVDGLVDALVAEAKAKLGEAVEDGRLTDAQRDAMLERLETRIAEHVDEAGFRLHGGRGRHDGPGMRGGDGSGFRGGMHGSPPGGESGFRLGGGTEPPAAA
jgi:hypothetical protein